MPLTRMKPSLAVLLALGLALAASGPSTSVAQEPPAGAETPTFGVQASSVVVDVVVRDKKGHLVRDLGADDFEVFEDGAKQTVDSFRVVDNGLPEPPEGEPQAAEKGAPAPPARKAAPAPSGTPSVIAFVFDRLTPNGRQQAQKAALSYTGNGYVDGDLVGVFSIDLALRTQQPFTNNLDLVREGLERAASQGNTQFANQREDARDKADSVMNADSTLGGLGSSATGGAGNAGVQTTASLVAAQQVSDQMQLNMLRTFDALERDQQGYATTNGLLAVVNGLKPIPGRKTVIFFSEGIAIPSNVEAQFRSVIASANRANVSVYTIDVGGLRTESGTREARDEILQAARARAAQEATGRDARGGAMMRTLERNEDLLRFNPESGLGQLADETGGFAVRDTNDFTKGFRRIEEDMRFYYVLSYAPTNESFDGRFRTISVKVKRPGVQVQGRKGYLAVRPDTVLPVRAYEGPAIALLDKNPKPDAFPIHLAALSFPEETRPGLAPVMVDVPGNAVAWAPQQPSGFHAQFTVVARLKDEKGREADRLSQEYNLSAPGDKLDAARSGDILFYQEAQLPAGRYTAEAVVYDALAQTASARTTTIDVPKTGDGPRMSSLFFIARMDKISAEEQKEGKSPLYYGETILYPRMGVPFSKKAGQPLGFFVSIYGKDIAAIKQANLEILQGTRSLGKIASPLPAPDAKGRIQYAGTLPLAGFNPGSYTLKVSVADGSAQAAREASFSVVE